MQIYAIKLKNILLMTNRMQYQHINKQTTARTSKGEQVLNQYLSFQTPSPIKSSETSAHSLLMAKPKCLSIISKKTRQAKLRAINRDQPLVEIPSIPIFEGMCSCINKQEDKKVLRVKQLKSTRKDLTSLLKQPICQTQEERMMTPINSLINLLPQ